MEKNPHFDFSHLSVAERIELAVDLWDSIAPDAGVDQLPLTEEQKAELDRRVAEAERNPDAAVPWEEVRRRLDDRLSSGG